MPMLASLPMYDLPYVRPHTDALWGAIGNSISNNGLNAPNFLTRSPDIGGQWRHSKLLFSQTCGFPFASKLRGHVNLIGTPDYGVVPNRPGWYYSVILCHKDDSRTQLSEFSGASLAYNETSSQSGCRAMMYTLLQLFGEKRHFGKCLQTGSHKNSALAISNGTADIAAIDIITWMHLKRDEPATEDLRVLMNTSPTPGLPYICSKVFDGETLAAAVKSALTNLPETTLDALFLKGFWPSTDRDYHLIAERAAMSAGIFSLHFSGD